MTPQLTSDQRKALDGESGDPVSPRELGIEPHTPMVESSLDPGLCDYVEMMTSDASHAGWRCGLTQGHDDEHYLDRPPGFDAPASPDHPVPFTVAEPEEMSDAKQQTDRAAAADQAQPTTNGDGPIATRGHPLD